LNGEAYQFLGKIINDGRYVDWAEESHETWRKTKAGQGWTYGPVRDNAKKTNPLMARFTDLPADVKGQNSLTPYAVVNFFRVVAGEKTLPELSNLLAAIAGGKDPALLNQLAEYVHSHFVAAQLAKGETSKTREDLRIYEELDEEARSWDTQLALDVINSLRQKISK
jgi:hypothetical protein